MCLFYRLGFLNLINTVSGNCLMSDLEQHAILLPFWGGVVRIILYSFRPWYSFPAGLIALAVSFFFGAQRVSAPVTCHLSPHLLTCWFIDELASQSPPPCEWSVRLQLLLERGCWAEPQWVTTSGNRQPIYCHRRTWWPSWEATLFPHPVTVLSVSGFSSFLKEFLIQTLPANSTGVVRQPVT